MKLILVQFFGVEVKGSKRWLDVKLLPRFQPIEYLKPFSQGSTRWTKALLIIYITSIILININFSKK